MNEEVIILIAEDDEGHANLIKKNLTRAAQDAGNNDYNNRRSKRIERCHSLGCSSYIVKPIEYDAFVNAIRHLGLYLAVVKVPIVNGGK